MLHAGDAYFMLDPDLSPHLNKYNRQRLAVIAMMFGFYGLSISLLRDAGLTPHQDIAKIETLLDRHIDARKIEAIWAKMPRAFAKYLGFLN